MTCIKKFISLKKSFDFSFDKEGEVCNVFKILSNLLNKITITPHMITSLYITRSRLSY